MSASEFPYPTVKKGWVSRVLNFSQIFSLVIYRVFFHPLAKYPGPFLAKISDAYQLYHAYKGDRHLEFWRMHQRYGTR